MDDSQLSPQILIKAYSLGMFPMADVETGQISWYKPDPRAIIPFEKFHVSRSLRKLINKQKYRVTYSTAFDDVMKHCSMREDTWISDGLIKSYSRMHRIGAAQSVEIWDDNELVGGVYGLNMGAVFFAESMFYKRANTSKLALFFLLEKLKESGFILLECQYLTEHLKSLGAEEISDDKYQGILQEGISMDVFFKT